MCAMERTEELEFELQQLRVANELLEQRRNELEEELQIAEQQIADRGGERFLASDEERMYIASSQRRTFHRPNCKWALYIVDSPNLIEFGSHREAVEAGYKPCKTCRA